MFLGRTKFEHLWINKLEKCWVKVKQVSLLQEFSESSCKLWISEFECKIILVEYFTGLELWKIHIGKHQGLWERE